jgi:predicted ester cyclase
MSTDLASLIRDLYERLNRRDPQVIAALIHEDLLDHTSHGEIQGRAAHEAHVLAGLEAFPDMRFDLAEVFVASDHAVVRGRLSGTHKGSFMGAPPSGKSFSIGWIAVYRFRGEKIAERWLQADDLGMMMQLGFVQMPRPA